MINSDCLEVNAMYIEYISAVVIIITLTGLSKRASPARYAISLVLFMIVSECTCAI